ncbi:hypothetical protein COY95_04300, partial [Candidatus Woesearchaeota archaeon CG_4_10_14_0_8_um_filter_47_5]
IGVHLILPDQDTAEVSNTSLLNFTCQLRRLGDDTEIGGWNEVWFSCITCNDINNRAWKMNETSRSRVTFQLDFTNETMNKKYNFTCQYVNASTTSFETYPPHNNDTKQIKIVEDLGSGGGVCDSDALCEAGIGETCTSCPDDCGFTKLPLAYNQSVNNATGCGCNFDGTCYTVYEDSGCYDCFPKITLTKSFTPAAPGPIFRADSYAKNITLNWSLINVSQSGSSTLLTNYSYTIRWDTTIIASGSTTNSTQRGSYNIPNTNAVGPHIFNITVNASGYQNYTSVTSFNVYGLLVITLLDPVNGTIVYKSGTVSTTATLMINVTDELNNTVSDATVRFIRPSGICKYGVYNEGDGLYSCVYEPLIGAGLGNNTWRANATRQYYLNKTSANRTLLVRDRLNATLTLNPPQGSIVYRYDGAPVNTTLYWNISTLNFKSGASFSGNVTYLINWSGIIVGNGTASSTSFNGSFDIPLNSSLGTNILRITLNASGQNSQNIVSFTNTTTFIVYGSLNVTFPAFANPVVFPTGTNNTIKLVARVTDMRGQVITGATVSFDIVNDSTDLCVGGVKKANGYYNCTYNPEDDQPVGNYSWVFNISKEYYAVNWSTGPFITIKKRLKINLTNKGNIYNRTRLINLTGVLLDDSNVRMNLTGYNCSFFITNLASPNATVLTTNGSCVRGWQTLCSNLPTQYAIKVNFTGSRTYYQIIDYDDQGLLKLYDTAFINITSPNASVNYEPGQQMYLNSTINDSCSQPPNTKINYTIVWYYKDELHSNAIIQSGKSGTYTLPSNAKGTGTFTALVQANYYHPVNDTLNIVVDEVLNARLITKNIVFWRNRSVKTTGQNFTLRGVITRGNGENISQSGINGTWSNYTCAWLVDGTTKGNTTTDSGGICSYNWSAGCSYGLGLHNFSMRLTGNTTPDLTILVNTSSGTNTLKDNTPSVYIHSPNASKFFYLDDVNLNVSVNDSCGNTNYNFSAQWRFRDANTDQIISSNKIDTWYVPSNAFGSSNITAIVSYAYFNTSKNTTFFSVWRNVELSLLNASNYLALNSINNVSCKVDVLALLPSEKAGFNVTFFIDENYSNPHIVQTNTQSIATYGINTAGMQNGAHTIECNISTKASHYYNVSTNLTKHYLNKTVILPESIIIDAFFVDNRELNLYNGQHYIANRTVFRSSKSPMYEPAILYLAANLSTVYANGTSKQGELVPLNNATARFYILNKSNNAVIDVVNCTTNLDAYRTRNRYPDQESFYDRYYSYVCLAQWNPPVSVPVGYYTVYINATKKDVAGFNTSQK